jgi:hypothetical protein
MIRTRRRNHRAGILLPAWPARPAAARLRRACVEPILARPPIRAIQACASLESDDLTITNSLAWRGQRVYEMKQDPGWF